MKRLILALAVLSVACVGKKDAPADTTVVVPADSAAKVVDTTKPKQSRYILISGDAPRPGCHDGGDGFQYCP